MVIGREAQSGRGSFVLLRDYEGCGADLFRTLALLIAAALLSSSGAFKPPLYRPPRRPTPSREENRIYLEQLGRAYAWLLEYGRYISLFICGSRSVGAYPPLQRFLSIAAPAIKEKSLLTFCTPGTCARRFHFLKIPLARCPDLYYSANDRMLFLNSLPEVCLLAGPSKFSSLRIHVHI